MQMHSDTEVMLNISSGFWRHWFQLTRAWFSRRAAGAEAWVEIALSHKHPPEDPIKATHQRGCLHHINQSSVALLLRPIIEGMQSQNYSDNNLKKQKINKKQRGSWVHLCVFLCNSNPMSSWMLHCKKLIRLRKLECPANTWALPHSEQLHLNSDGVRTLQQQCSSDKRFRAQTGRSVQLQDASVGGPRGRMQSTLHSQEMQGFSKDGYHFVRLCEIS